MRRNLSFGTAAPAQPDRQGSAGKPAPAWPHNVCGTCSYVGIRHLRHRDGPMTDDRDADGAMSFIFEAGVLKRAARTG